jgi:hypothetical protein
MEPKASYYTAVLTLHLRGKTCRPETVYCLLEQQERAAALAAVRARIERDWTPFGFEASTCLLRAYTAEGQPLSEERVDLREPSHRERRQHPMQVLPTTYHAEPVPAEHTAWLEEVSRLQLAAFVGSPFDCWQNGEYLVMQSQATAFPDADPPAWTITPQHGPSSCIRVTAAAVLLARIGATTEGQVSFYRPEHQELYQQLAYYRGGPWFLAHARSVRAWLTVKPGDTVGAFGGVYRVLAVEDTELEVCPIGSTRRLHIARYGLDTIYQPGEPLPIE